MNTAAWGVVWSAAEAGAMLLCDSITGRGIEQRSGPGSPRWQPWITRSRLQSQAAKDKKEPNRKFKILHCIFPREDSDRLPKAKDGKNNSDRA